MSQPDSELVIREVVPDVWTFSRPFAMGYFFPFGGRSTAIKLANGSVWVLASTPLTEDTAETINRLGPVKWIMAGDAEHNIYLKEYKDAYPEARLVVVENLYTKMRVAGVDVAGAYGVDTEGTKYGFEDEIRAVYFSGFANQDVAFYHIASKTLVVADLVFNMGPGMEQYSKSPSSSKIPLLGSLKPDSWLQKYMLWSLGKDKDAMRRDIKTVLEWELQRIIMCHGDVIEGPGNAEEAWRTAYSRYLAA